MAGRDGMKGIRWAEGGLLLGLTLLLVLYPSESARGAREGLVLCGDLLVPALFPFFVLSSLLVETGLTGRLARPLERPARFCLGVGGAGTAALLLGLVGGYPVGLRTLAELRSAGDCPDREARRAALFCNSCGPAFLLGAAGAGVFGSRQAGLLLLAANGLAAIGLAAGLRLLCGPATDGAMRIPRREAPLPEVFPRCVSGAFSSVLGVCGYVILFSVLAALADCTGILALCQRGLRILFPGPDGDTLARSLTLGLLELSTGTAALREAAETAAALPLAAFLLGWGGLSVHGQSLPFLRQAGGQTGPYLAAKLVHGLLAAGLSSLLLRLFPLSLPAMASPPGFPVPILPGRDLTALWITSGAYFSLLRRKRGGKNREDTV